MKVIEIEKKALSYNDIALVPRVVSTLEHRHEADTSVNFCGLKISVPLIGSPMPDVCNGSMAYHLANAGAMGIIHRFQTIGEQVKEYELAYRSLMGDADWLGNPFACAVGATGDYQVRFEKLYEAGCRIFCIDTANGANIQVRKAVDYMRNEKLFDGYIIVGNIATAEAYSYIATEMDVDAVRVGIAGGSVCETKTETGIQYPMVSSILECVDERNKLIFNNKLGGEQLKKIPLIIADGGIQTPSDLAKALALGADIVMAGGIFAGTAEAPGSVLKDKQGHKYKIYSGAASFSVQKQHQNEEPAYNEGAETFVPYKGEVLKVVTRFQAGLQSSMSYMNARNLDEFRKNASLIQI